MKYPGISLFVIWSYPNGVFRSDINPLAPFFQHQSLEKEKYEIFHITLVWQKNLFFDLFRVKVVFSSYSFGQRNFDT